MRPAATVFTPALSQMMCDVFVPGGGMFKKLTAQVVVYLAL